MLAVNVVNSAGWGVYLFLRWMRGTDPNFVSFGSSTIGAVFALIGLALTFGRYRRASGWILVATSLSSTLFSASSIEPERASLALFFLGVPVAVAALMISSRAGIGTFVVALTGNILVGLLRPEMTLEQVAPPAGFLVYLSAILIVATFVKERLERVHEARLAESAKMASLGQMSAGIAHEINNPLFVLNVSASLLAELVLEEPLDLGKLKDLSKKVTAMSLRIEQTVKGLKNFAREASADPLHVASVRDVLNTTRDLCRHRFTEEKVLLTLPELPAGLTFECRAVQISQVLVNLLNNAVDAVAGATEKWVKVEVLDQGNLIVLAVTDSGTGVQPDLRKRIMNPFFTTKSEGKGTGLGLSLSLQIARDHGGRLFLDTESPVTRFVLEVPKKPAGQGSQPVSR